MDPAAAAADLIDEVLSSYSGYTLDTLMAADARVLGLPQAARQARAAKG